MFKKLLHGKRKSALLNLTWSGLLCRVVWSVSQLLYLLQRAGHFKFFSPSFFVGLELTLLPRTGPGDRARFRYQLLQECHVTVFDLSGYDRAQELKGAETRAPVGYELGIASALGKPVVIIGKEGLDLPFDVDLEPILLQHNSADLEQFTGALDRALYGLQRGGSGESVAATAAYVRELAVGHNDPKVDAILKMLSADTLK